MGNESSSGSGKPSGNSNSPSLGAQVRTAAAIAGMAASSVANATTGHGGDAGSAGSNLGRAQTVSSQRFTTGGKRD